MRYPQPKPWTGRAAVLIVALAATGGCALPAQRASFESDDPMERSLAASRAARQKDTRSIPQLVEMLDSADPAQRMIAIASLEQITGQRLGYDPAGPEWERRRAVRSWITWVQDGGGSPAPVPGSSEARGPEGVGGSQPISPGE